MRPIAARFRAALDKIGGRIADMNYSFDDFAGSLDYPMFVVTTCAGDDIAGCLVGFATQTSIDPSGFLVGISTANHTYEVARHATHIAVHALSRGHSELARLFGSETGDVTNKFDHCAWHRGPGGVPVLEDAWGWFAGTVTDRVTMGDHVGHFLAPVDGSLSGPAPELLSFSDVRSLDPGHESS